MSASRLSLPIFALAASSLLAQESTDRVDLAAKWTKGEVVHQKLVIEQSQEMTGGQSMKMNQTMAMTVSCEVVDVTDSGTATVRMCHESIRQVVRNGNVEIVYDSTLEEQAPLAVQTGLVALASMLDRPFSLDVDSSGRVVKLHDDVGQFRQAVLDGLGGTPATAAMRPMLEEMLSDGAMRQSVEASYQMLPKAAVTLGVAYTRDIDAPNPVGKTTIHAKVTPTRAGGRGMVNLDFEGTLDVSIDNTRPTLQQIDMKFVGGTVSGRNVFDLSRGQMDRSSSTNTIRMEIRAKGNDPTSEPILRQVVKTKMTMETLSVDKK